MHDRAVYRVHEGLQPLDSRLQHLPVRLQRRDQIELRIVDDVLDLQQPQTDLAVEQNLLKPEQRIIAVVAIAIVAD